jgi:hypothetical protein
MWQDFIPAWDLFHCKSEKRCTVPTTVRFIRHFQGRVLRQPEFSMVAGYKVKQI